VNYWGSIDVLVIFTTGRSAESASLAPASKVERCFCKSHPCRRYQAEQFALRWIVGKIRTRRGTAFLTTEELSRHFSKTCRMHSGDNQTLAEAGPSELQRAAIRLYCPQIGECLEMLWDQWVQVPVSTSS
jgi:hypothetical protein